MTGEKISASLLGQLVRNVAYVNENDAKPNSTSPSRSPPSARPGRRSSAAAPGSVRATVTEVAVTESFSASIDVRRQADRLDRGREPMAAEAKPVAIEAVAICAEL